MWYYKLCLAKKIGLAKKHSLLNDTFHSERFDQIVEGIYF